jgi:hypothetical protein
VRTKLTIHAAKKDEIFDSKIINEVKRAFIRYKGTNKQTASDKQKDKLFFQA